MQNLYLYKKGNVYSEGDSCCQMEGHLLHFLFNGYLFAKHTYISNGPFLFDMPSTSVYPQRTVHSSTSSQSGKNKVGNLTVKQRKISGV